MKRFVFLTLSHITAVAIGFAAGIYALPVLTAPAAPSSAELETLAGIAEYRGEFRKDLAGSDLLHWGEGIVSVSERTVSLAGKVAPGPDYKLYLSPEFVETGSDFQRLKERGIQLGDVKTFANFIVPVPEAVDVSEYNTVVVWCEAFSQFITAAQYRP
jgi:hypothetical protein